MAIGHNLETASFEIHFSGSTAPQAFSRPDRRMLTPARVGRVKVAASSAVTEGLALIGPSTTARWLDRGLLSSFFSLLLALV
jgi:hypothetical protein